METHWWNIPFAYDPEWERKLGKTREYARKLLRVRMSELSKDLYCAGWYGGVEYALWEKDIEELK